MSTRFHLKDINFYRDQEEGSWGDDVVWIDHDGELDLPAPHGSGDIAKLLINVGVDGMFTIVHHQKGDRAVLAKVIEDLTFLLEQLDAVYPEGEPRGRCLTFGNWGRCKATSDHAAEHDFPTEEEWNRENPPPRRSAS